MARTAKTTKDLFTFADFRALVPDGQKADLIDGVVYMASPDTDTSDDLTGFVHFLLRGYNYARKLGGQVRGSRYAYRLTKYRAPEPDVGFIGRDRVHLVKKLGMRGGPDVAVEIVSRDSRARDYKLKRRIYQKAGVSEYWIIDPLKKQVLFLRLRDGQYVRVTLKRGHIFVSKAVPGFWFDTHWLMQDALPDGYECLQQILGSKP